MKLTRTFSPRPWMALTLAGLLGLSAPAWAQLRVGMPSGFTGSVAAGVKENHEGAKLYFDTINARGGVNGQKIELISLDDKFDPKLAAENARTLIEEVIAESSGELKARAQRLLADIG